MLWLAASATLALGATASLQQLSSSELSAWRKVKQSIVTFDLPGGRSATATLIDAHGWFIAEAPHKDLSGTFKGHFFDGSTITARLVSIDAPTQLMLLKSESPMTGHLVAPIYSQSFPEVNSAHPFPLIGVLSTGPIRAELVTPSHIGVLNSSRSALSLSEIQFEAPANLIGGAPVFATDGALVGVLEATLSDSPEPSVRNLTAAGASTSYGPARMTVAYSPSADTIRHVVAGFLSPSHNVVRAAVGVYCRNASGHGAYVESVQMGSPAEAAGIRHGDVIVRLNGAPVQNQISFARIMLRQRVGSSIPILVRRGEHTMKFIVKVGM
jgi:S1-C subfamily serine protease